MKAVISIEDEPRQLPRIFHSEQKRLVNQRAQYTVSSQDNNSIISIEARDAVALRAVMNSVCKILIVHEKTKKVIEDGFKSSSTTTPSH